MALATNKVAQPWGPRATFFAPSATWPWPGAAARPWDIRERPLDIRERPLDSRERPLDFRTRWDGVEWGGAGTTILVTRIVDQTTRIDNPYNLGPEPSLEKSPEIQTRTTEILKQ